MRVVPKKLLVRVSAIAFAYDMLSSLLIDMYASFLKKLCTQVKSAGRWHCFTLLDPKALCKVVDALCYVVQADCSWIKFKLQLIISKTKNRGS